MNRTTTQAALHLTRALAIFALAVSSAGCGAEAYDDYEDVETTELPISGGWTTLSLINGWQNYYANDPPAVGVVNGVVTFRGAIKATSPTSNVPFVLSATAFQPDPANRLFLRTVMRTTGGTNVGGMLHFMALDDDDGISNEFEIYQDGQSPVGVGTAAKNFTSLDGLSFDRESGDEVSVDYNVWEGEYGFRIGEGCSGCGLYVKLVDGFVRFQGYLKKTSPTNYTGFIGTLPSSLYIPGQMVMVPLHTGDPGVTGAESWGALKIEPDGKLYLHGNPVSQTSFEGVWFSKTNSGNVNLPLNTAAGWGPYSARTVKVGKYGDVVRLQGAISGGNSTTIATLPTGYRPTHTVRVGGVANGFPVTISISTSGVMTFAGVDLGVATTFLSLDGVSFGL